MYNSLVLAKIRSGFPLLTTKRKREEFLVGSEAVASSLKTEETMGSQESPKEKAFFIVKEDGSRVDKPSEIKDEIVGFFSAIPFFN